jgi:hypothetical protein
MADIRGYSMLKRRNLFTLLPLFAISTLSTIGTLTLTSTAHAQQRIAKPGLGFTFVMPEGYGEDDRVNKIRAQQGGPPIALYLTDGGLNNEDAAHRMSKTLLTGIYVVLNPMDAKRSGGSVSVKVSGEEEGKKKEFSNDEVQQLFNNRNKTMTKEEREATQAQIEKIAKSFLPPKFAYQNGAMIAVDGYPSVAILTSYENEFSQSEITVRFILVSTKRNSYLFYAGYANSEFESRSQAFTKFMQSVKFVERSESERKKTAAPAASSKKKK